LTTKFRNDGTVCVSVLCASAVSLVLQWRKVLPRKEFLVFGAPLISEDEIQAVVDTLRSGWIGTGPRVKEFEQRFAQYVGAKHAVALNSCTSGLRLSLHGLDVGPGDEVITTPMTFCATANVIVQAGATPVFVDVDRATGNIDISLVEAAITAKTKAILPVHFAGRAVNLDSLQEIANRRGLAILQDAAHAIETEWQGKRLGEFDGCACFSFYANKNITTAEGGMVVTNDAALAERMHVLSLHGINADAWRRFRSDGPSHVEVLEPGFKFNMTDIQAALGLGQLAKIDEYLKRREELWAYYNDALADLPLILPAPVEENCRHARHLYQVLLDTDRADMDRDALRDRLKEKNIGTGCHYLAVHLHHYYATTFGIERGSFPNAEFISDRTMSLPLSPAVTLDDAGDVVDTLREILG
jgi:dTDP-4-amino-4,6-dideoxygalactose transaminase